jgi:two-component system CheB/CheR fusion protein
MSEKFHTVGIGVSDGGQQGLLEFLHQLPSEPDMAFVIVCDIPYNLDEIITKASAVQTVPVKHGGKIKKNRLYIAPTNALISINDGRFKLEEQHDNDEAIDFFFTSLAHESGENAVGVILSTAGQHGFAGLADIDTYRGKILIQSRSATPFSSGSLPLAAIDAVHPTLVASPATLALCLTSFVLFNEFKRPSVESSTKERSE